ncbi:acetyl-CoA carboxylase biotin carboxylase subunit [Myxococcota bacterium]|nr:acetyl-CoA carboxylase biotin carboxylase subunit [Myxococcota bacterium]
MFRRILVANRGEIAVRVMRTCRELGIPTVAVYSEPDRMALHTLYATEAYPIGPAPSRESYLNIERIIDAAKKSGADAIHPGYGFLSERANFAQACKDAGITFIGPSPHSITTMGEKTVARRAMISAGVPVVPGTAEPVATVELAVEAAKKIGYPIMVKAAAGGGGKGMRLVHDEPALVRAFEAASREALSAFGDGSIYLERFIQSPRHIEIQIFGDTHGNIIHLNERECSIQRRNQKVIEEAPSAFVDPEMRAAMGEIAVKAGRAVDYVGAGTIEFLADENKNFYFLEMNTRLQVEHPVTELTTGYDLVREQILVAAGHKLGITPKAPNGHAIEARVYAENPANNFAPSPGRISHIRTPGGPGVRIDAGVYAGAEVTPFYDPMISKLSVWAHDRETAARRLDRALGEYVVNGIDTNITFLRRILQHPAYREGKTDTGFIDRHISPEQTPSDNAVMVAMIAAAIRQYEYGHELATKIVRGQEGGAASKWRELGRRDAFLRRLGF